MRLADFHFGCPLRVRWSEADPQGIVFNGHYLNYADVGINLSARHQNATRRTLSVQRVAWLEASCTDIET